jgi:hypothetical protein
VPARTPNISIGRDVSDKDCVKITAQIDESRASGLMAACCLVRIDPGETRRQDRRKGNQKEPPS